MFLNSFTIGIDASNLSPENPAPHPIKTFSIIIKSSIKIFVFLYL